MPGKTDAAKQNTEFLHEVAAFQRQGLIKCWGTKWALPLSLLPALPFCLTFVSPPQNIEVWHLNFRFAHVLVVVCIWDLCLRFTFIWPIERRDLSIYLQKSSDSYSRQTEHFLVPWKRMPFQGWIMLQMYLHTVFLHWVACNGSALNTLILDRLLYRHLGTSFSCTQVMVCAHAWCKKSVLFWNQALQLGFPRSVI